MSDSDTLDVDRLPECQIKGCNNTANRAELWKNGQWYPYCDNCISLGFGTDEVTRYVWMRSFRPRRKQVRTDGGVDQVDLDEDRPGHRLIKSALLEDEQLEQLADVRRALRKVDVDELEPAAADDVRYLRDCFESAWRVQFESTREQLELEVDTCPSL